MKHLTYGDKILLVDDATADAVIAYAVLLGDAHRSDAVAVRALGSRGEHTVTTLVLNSSVPLSAEDADAPEVPFAIDERVTDLRARIARLSDPPRLQPGDPRPPRDDATDIC